MQPARVTRRRIEHSLRADAPLDYERLSEPILVRRAKDGDRRALEVLCARHAPRVERLCRHLLDDPEDARDAAQESLAKLCSSLGQFRGRSRLSTWLHRLTVNCCRDVAERQRRRRCEALSEDTRAAEADGDPLANPGRAADLSALREELCEALSGLPAAQARVLVLKDALGLSFPEVASVTELPLGTAKCYAHRARGRLRARLAELEPAGTP